MNSGLKAEYLNSEATAPRPRVYTVEETARLLRIGRSAAYEAVRRGQIPALRLGRKLRVPRTALEQMLCASEPKDTWTVEATSTGCPKKPQGGPTKGTAL
jgi:excisionase family DNA binding protein